MTGRSQNAARGRHTKETYVVGASGNLFFRSYSNTTAMLTANSTGLKIQEKANSQMSANSTGLILLGGIRISNKSTAVITGNSTGLVLTGGVRFSSKTTAVITGNATGIVVAGGVKVSNKLHIRANTTGFAFETIAAKPTNKRDAAYKIAFIKTATGTGCIAINTTGTAWKYLQVTSVLPT